MSCIFIRNIYKSLEPCDCLVEVIVLWELKRWIKKKNGKGKLVFRIFKDANERIFMLNSVICAFIEQICMMQVKLTL